MRENILKAAIPRRPMTPGETHASRRDVHQHVARGNHAADRMHREQMNDPGQRRTDLEQPEFILDGDFLLAQIADPGLRLAQLLDDVGDEIMLDLPNLQLRLSDLGLGLRDFYCRITYSAMIAHQCKALMRGR
jgi:hypothetical protein